MIDGQGIEFAGYRDLLPARAADFPPRQIVRDKSILTDYRWAHDHCQLCGRNFRRGHMRAELHHIIGGGGRSDEPCNLIMLCNGYHGCHGKVHGNLSGILYAKWKTDCENTDWVRLAILYGAFLPEPKESDNE